MRTVEGLGLRARQTLSLVLLLSVAALALSSAGWWYGRRLVIARLEEQAATTVRWLARSLEFPLAVRDREGLLRQMELAAADADVLYVTLADAEGRTLATAGRGLDAGAQALLESELPFDGAGVAWLEASGGEPFYGCVHALQDPAAAAGSGPAVLRVALSSGQARRILSELQAALALTAAGLIGLGMLVARRLGSRLAAPIEELARAAGEVSRGRRDVALPRGAPGEIGHLARLFADMTEALARQERELQQMADRELDRQRTRWDVTINALGDPVAVCDAAGRVVEVNDAFRERAAQGGVVGAWFLHALKGPAAGSAGGGPQNSAWELTLGETHFVASRFPLPDEGAPPGCVVILRDVTERDRARDQLAQAEKLGALGLLIAGVAHELNNPLAGILGFAQLALRREQTEQGRRGFERVAVLAERCVRVVRNLLAFARPHSPERCSVDLNALVGSTLELRSHDQSLSKIRLALDLEEGLPSFSADPHQLQQVLLNLVLNAEQALHAAGGGAIRISTRVSDGERVVLAVEDDGPGVPAEHLARIFDPFFTTKPPGVGTGLGLSLSHGIVREHGGTLRGENRPGGGARFTVELPLAEAPAHAAAHDEPRREAVSGRRILVVDDDEALRDVIQEGLSESGYTVQVAATVPEALTSLETARFDLVLSDLRMPGLDGRDLFAEITKSRPGQRVAFVTGDSVSGESRRFLEESGRPVLQKPFHIDDLVDFVQRAAADLAPAAS